MQNNENFAENANAPLIRVEQNEQGQTVVSARELHTFLQSKQQFADWIKTRIEKYNFLENQDFTLHKVMKRKSWATEYMLTLSAAKELAMVENNEMGKKARQYFIDCEKQLKQVQALVSQAREETLLVEIKKLASRVENMEQQYQWLLEAHEDFAESIRHILEELPHAQTLFEILLERTHKLEMSKEVQELKNTLLTTIQLLQGRVQDIERALNLHTKHFVYVFYNVITDEYRIGKADILDKRQRQLHTVEQDIRQYLAIATRNAREALLLERYLQTYFNEKRTQGDWFKLDAEDLKMLALFALLHETV